MGYSAPPPPPPSSPSGTSPGASTAPSASAAQTHARQVADTLATFTQMLGFYVKEVGFNMDSNIQKLLHNAANGLWNTDRFINALAHTKEFHKAFPGILNKNGTLAMSPTDYISARNAIGKAAASAGVNINNKQLNQMMVNGVDPTIAAQRFQVEASYQQNQGTLQAFNAELKAAGHQPMNKASMNKFLMGQSPPQFYSLYRDWQTRMSAQAAGFQIATPIRNKKGHVTGWNSNAGDLELSRKQELAIAAGAGGPGQAAPNLTQAAQMFRDVLPESRMAAAGISKDDIIQYLYGGPKQAQIQQAIDQFGKNLAAEQQNTGPALQAGNIGQRGLASQNRAQGY